LPNDVATLQHLVAELLQSLHERDRTVAQLQHRLDGLLRRLYGPRSEPFRPDQPLLFAQPEAAPADAAAAEANPTPPAPRRARPHGRRRLPAHLPRETRHHTLTEAERLCGACGQRRAEIGVESSEQLEYHPASLLVVEHVVHKYACRCGAAPLPAGGPALESSVMSAAEPSPEPSPPPSPAGSSTRSAPVVPPVVPVVLAAAKPALPIPKGLPGPGLLAHLIVSKYVDHLPLHRLERVYERQGVFLPRSTLSDWLAASAELLRPLYDRLVAAVLLSRALHTDDTPVKRQEPATHQLSTARLWGYLGDAAHPYNVFDFTVNRKRDGPVQFLKGYQGYLHADAFSGYDRLYLPEPRSGQARIIEVACNAHARRKFYEARSSDALRSHQALAYYGQLYALERSARDLAFSDAQKLQMRQDFAVPILATFHAWLQAQREQVLPKSPLAEAIGYALNQWDALRRYTEAGFLAIDNNAAEREMKRIALGRKNWLFVGSPRGGQTAAVLLSFTSTCARLGVEPWAYLREVLTRLPTLPAAELDTLLPDRWQAARQAPDPSSPSHP
jgi:transposase